MEHIRISLAVARVNAGYSPSETEKRMDISVKTIQNHESGKTEPGWKMAEKYSALYGLPLDFIFLGCDSA